MYWVIALFDDKTEKRIQKMWEALTAAGISDFEKTLTDARPHLTLGSYEELDKDEYIKMLADFYEDKSGLVVDFNNLGTFLNYGTLFYAPTVTKALLDFHSRHHQCFEKFNTYANPLYLPGKWIPHCTLANQLSHEKLAEGFRFCLENGAPFAGRIVKIGLIELDEEKTERTGLKDSRIIYTKKLS